MKINKEFMRYSSVILLILTIFPLFLEVGSAAFSVLMISIGGAGCLWGMTNLFEEIRWDRIKQNSLRKR